MKSTTTLQSADLLKQRVEEYKCQLAAIRGAVGLLGATIAATNPPGYAWSSVRDRYDELCVLLEEPFVLAKAHAPKRIDPVNVGLMVTVICVAAVFLGYGLHHFFRT